MKNLVIIVSISFMSLTSFALSYAEVAEPHLKSLYLGMAPDEAKKVLSAYGECKEKTQWENPSGLTDEELEAQFEEQYKDYKWKDSEEKFKVRYSFMTGRRLGNKKQTQATKVTVSIEVEGKLGVSYDKKVGKVEFIWVSDTPKICQTGTMSPEEIMVSLCKLFKIEFSEVNVTTNIARRGRVSQVFKSYSFRSQKYGYELVVNGAGEIGIVQIQAPNF